MTPAATTADELVARFSQPEGFRKLFGWFVGKRARAAHALFTSAAEKGATRAYTLDRREYKDNIYYVKAISLRGDLDETVLARMTREASLLPLGTLRYEGQMAPTLPDAMGSVDDAADIHALSRPADGILVYPVSFLDAKRRDASWALWALHEGEAFVFPIDDKEL